MLWARPCQTPQFGMPFYINSLIFKASLLPILWFWCVSSDVGAARVITVIDFWSLQSVQSLPLQLSSAKRWERCTLTAESELDSEPWEHNLIWLAVCCRSLLSHCAHDAKFDTSFACRQHNTCISVYLKEMNIQTKKAQKEKDFQIPFLVQPHAL